MFLLLQISENLFLLPPLKKKSEFSRPLPDGSTVVDYNGTLLFNDGKNKVTVNFSKPTIINEHKAGDDSEAEEDKGLPLGARLIAKSDCKTCHNAEVKTVGPSYRDIAVKYETNASNVRSLVQKLEMEAVAYGAMWP